LGNKIPGMDTQLSFEHALAVNYDRKILKRKRLKIILFIYYYIKRLIFSIPHAQNSHITSPEQD